MLAKHISTSSTKVDLFAGVENTGLYEVIITRGYGSYLATSSGATDSTAVLIDALIISTGSSGNFNVLRFLWDSATPLYTFSGGGTGQVSYILANAGSTDVNLSVGPCS